MAWPYRAAGPRHTVEEELNTTRWQDWYAVLDAEVDKLRQNHDRVFVAGLSMGGCLALRLAEEHGTEIAGVIVVNPSVSSDDKRLLALPVLQRLVPSLPGIANDIKKPGVTENAYDRLPLKALYSVSRLWKLTRSGPGEGDPATAAVRSTVDHVVEPSSSRRVLEAVSSRTSPRRCWRTATTSPYWTTTPSGFSPIPQRSSPGSAGVSTDA